MPRLTATVAALCFLAWTLPDWARWLAYDREAVFSGQIWRLVSGHLCHASGAHLFWNLLSFAVLGAWLEHANPRSFRLLMETSATGIGAVLLFQPQVAVYVGMSGVNSSLAAFLITTMVRFGRARQRAAASALALLFLLKITYELGTGRFLFVTLEAGWTPLPSAHLAGAVIGLLVPLIGWFFAPAHPGAPRPV
ncbi:MAG: rhombosortase [Nitrospirota bacterium]|nr:rhombosortase [Nitrospirota bacterium]